MDDHMGLANSLALKIVGITNDTEDPNVGAITRTPDGAIFWVHLYGIASLKFPPLHTPDHLLDDADSAIRKLGAERAQKGSYLFQSLLANEAVLAFGSDWPVVDINPLGSVKTAMKRIPPGWESAWIPSECVNLTDALNAYTISAARASFLEEDVGSLSPGKFADFVVLLTDSWDRFVAEGSAAVKATYVGGIRAYP